MAMRPQGEYDYRYFRASKKFQNDPERLEELVKVVKSYNPVKVLDVGCGLGTLVRYLRKEGIDAYGIDNAKVLKERLWLPEEDYFYLGDSQDLPFGDKMFTVVISTDFFEHLLEEKIEPTVKEMYRVGKIVIARVAYEQPLDKIQAKYHLTNKPKEWWDKKLVGVKQI